MDDARRMSTGPGDARDATPERAHDSRGQGTSSHLPAPAPSFPALVAIHLRLTIRESRWGSAILALAAVALPIAVLLTPPPAAALDSFTAAGQIAVLAWGMMVMTVLVAFLQPEAVWRSLGPGARGVMDSLPVTRRRHRMARVIAGAGLPILLIGSLVLTGWIMNLRGGMTHSVRFPLAETGGWGMLAAALSLLAAYALGSTLALRFGKVLLPLLTILLIAYVVPLILTLLGIPGMTWPLRFIHTHPFSPARLFVVSHPSSAADLLYPALVWLAVFGGLVTYVAGRHDEG